MGYQYVTLETIPAQSLVPEFVRQMSLDCGELIGRELRAPVRMIFINSSPIDLEILYRDFSTRYPEVNWNPVFHVIAQDSPHAIALDSSYFLVPDHYQNLCLIFGPNGRSYIFHELVHFINSFPRGNQGSLPNIDLAHFILNEYEAEYFGVKWGLCYALERPRDPFGHFMPSRNTPPRLVGDRLAYNMIAGFLAQRRLAMEGEFDEARAILHHESIGSLEVSNYETRWSTYLDDNEALLPGTRELLLRLEAALTVWNLRTSDARLPNCIAEITAQIREIQDRVSGQGITARELQDSFLHRLESRH